MHKEGPSATQTNAKESAGTVRRLRTNMTNATRGRESVKMVKERSPEKDLSAGSAEGKGAGRMSVGKRLIWRRSAPM